MKRICFFIVCAVLCALPAFASEDVLIVTTEYRPPFRTQTDAGGVAGLDHDILNAIGRELNVTFKWHPARGQDVCWSWKTDRPT